MGCECLGASANERFFLNMCGGFVAKNKSRENVIYRKSSKYQEINKLKHAELPKILKPRKRNLP
jgi:hypothetical protein